MIASGCDDNTNLEVLELVKKYDNVYGTLGYHPEDIEKLTADSLKIIENNLSNPKIVAIGEIGLDYYWTKENRDKQISIFEYQLKLAQKYNMPVVIHSRDSIQDVYDIVKKYNIKGVIHCFNSSLEMAREFIKLGYKIGVGGVVTFKNAKKIQEIVKNIDIKDILIETDSPYLTPEPFRSKKNEPANVYFVAKKISELKCISVDKVISITGQNAITQFDLNIQK